MSKETYRTPAVAGMFYEKDPELLSKIVDKYISSAVSQEISGKIFGIVAPHAGYIYSGQTAAFGYKQLVGRQYDTVVVISPSHREYFEGVSIYNGAGYSTPLGDIDIDQELKEKFINNAKYMVEGIMGHRSEHALEVQLPFLQRVLKDFRILPLVMGDQNRETCNALGDTLADILKDEKNTLIVASSDLSHFHPSNKAKVLDDIIIKNINDFEIDELLTNLSHGKTEACGGGPVAAMMKASKILGANNARVLKYSDSGDISGDKSEVVGYLSAIVWSS
jgi:MEMO1 family protein